MAMQIPDYSVFAQMPVSSRRQSLEMIKRFAGQHATSLFLQVYQFDPDADLREMARRELAAQGVTPPTEPTPMNVQSQPDNGGLFGGSPFSFTTSVSRDEHDATLAAAGIDGGNGRPVQRGPQHANIFTLYRGHKKYLTGERNHIPHNPFSYLLIIGILVVSFGITVFAFRAFGGTVEINGQVSDMTDSTLNSVSVLMGGIFALISLVTIGFWVWNVRRNRRYERDGTLLLGQILSAQGQWVSSTDGDGGTSRSYKVTVHYRVRLPDGRVFDGQETHTRGDLARGGIPMSGAPVALLVIDPEHMRLL